VVQFKKQIRRIEKKKLEGEEKEKKKLTDIGFGFFWILDGRSFGLILDRLIRVPINFYCKHNPGLLTHLEGNYPTFYLKLR
jgi:hypothetical protein